MKSLIATVFICLCSTAYAQTNPMFKSEKEIRNLMSDNNAHFDGSDYSSTGERCIKYSFAMDNPEKYLQVVFFISLNGVCDGANYYYPHSSELKNIVVAINSIDDFKKVDDSFAWINTKGHFSIEIVRPPIGDGFLFQYNRLK
ncbi:hypothetical protein BH09BAC6_BH09BAC6_33910 [soil metagenome]|jgi:hypothetical protein